MYPELGGIECYDLIECTQIIALTETKQQADSRCMTVPHDHIIHRLNQQ